MNITIHSQEDFEFMRKAGRLAAETLDFIAPYVKVGVTTNELNDLCHDFIINAGAIPAPLNYRGYPKSICTSKMPLCAMVFLMIHRLKMGIF